VSEPKIDPQVATVDQAINQVLRAEREARGAVERCREEAAAIVAAAEERARGISARTEQRIKSAHRLADKAVECALRELLRAEAREAPGETTQADEARVTRAVEALVDELIGPNP
jgi:vacuolar-type H+-ATPase subunit H